MELTVLFLLFKVTRMRRASEMGAVLGQENKQNRGRLR